MLITNDKQEQYHKQNNLNHNYSDSRDDSDDEDVSM